MSVIRVEKTRDYTIMSNHHLRNRELSLKAKGIMSLMLSLPDDWDYSVKGLASLSRDKLDSVRTALKELEQQGYLVMNRVRDDQGRLSNTEYVLRENPILEKPILENPILEKPILENPTQLNTNIIKDLQKEKKNELNTEYIYSRVVDFLNREAGTNYKSTTKGTVNLIKARLKEGFTVDDFEKVISKKCRQWGNTDMAKYLRPETLFGNKFEGYLNESECREMPKQNAYARQEASEVTAEAIALCQQLGF